MSNDTDIVQNEEKKGLNMIHSTKQKSEVGLLPSVVRRLFQIAKNNQFLKL